MNRHFEYNTITTESELKKTLNNIDWSKDVVFDTESTGLGVYDTLLGISIYQKGTVLPSFVVRRTPFFEYEGIPIDKMRDILNPYLQKCEAAVEHNCAYDLRVFKMNGFELPPIRFDTIAAIHLVDPDAQKKLETQVELIYGYKKPDFKEVSGLKWDKIVWNENTHKLFTLDQLSGYASADGYWTDKIKEHYEPLIDKYKLRKVLEKIEIRLAYVLADMKIKGVRIDVPYLKKLSVLAAEEENRLRQKIYTVAGAQFNVNSTQQTAKILYDKLKLPVVGKTKSGNRSCDARALGKLKAKGHEIADLLIQQSELSTLRSSFIDKIPTVVDRDGRLRGDFSSVGARTGRFASSKPNMQNMPVKGKLQVRKAFVPAQGKKLIVLDWSQIELRVAAHLSKDKKLQQAFIEGRDIHQEVATALNISRKAAKVVNFGILYGLGAPNLAEKAGCSESEAEKMLTDYGKTYKGISDWKHYVEQDAIRNGYVRNMFGRLRRLPGIKSDNKKEYYHALRQAVNTQVQGACADLMKLGMIRLYEEFQKLPGKPADILLTVHDELVTECVTDRCLEVFKIKKDILENIVQMDVPIIADGKIVNEWSQMKDDDYKGLFMGSIDTRNYAFDDGGILTAIL